MILAFQNVADTLRALKSDAEALQAGVTADSSAKAAFELAQQQYKLGTIPLVTVLNAEQTYQQAELALVQAQANQFSDAAALFQALGGGWWNRADVLPNPYSPEREKPDPLPVPTAEAEAGEAAATAAVLPVSPVTETRP